MVKAWRVKVDDVLYPEYLNNRLAYCLLTLVKALCKCSVFNSSIINAIDACLHRAFITWMATRKTVCARHGRFFWREAIKKRVYCTTGPNHGHLLFWRTCTPYITFISGGCILLYKTNTPICFVCAESVYSLRSVTSPLQPQHTSGVVCEKILFRPHVKSGGHPSSLDESCWAAGCVPYEGK